MKLRGTLTQEGISTLARKFLPVLEKFGKTCQLLFGPEQIHILQTDLNTDGVHTNVNFSMETLFDAGKYTCTSRHLNLIAFQIEVGLLLRVLKGAATNNAEVVDIKLTTKKVTAPDGQGQSKPFLSVTATGASLNMVLDVPTSAPYNNTEIDALVAAKIGNFCPFYIDLAAGAAQMQSIVDRLKGMDDAVMLATSKGGDAYLLVETTGIALGVQLRDLPVYPQALHVPTAGDRNQTANEQLRKALESGEAVYVYVQLKHLARVLQANNPMDPSQMLCGIAENGSYVHFLYVFRDNNDPNQVFDESVTLAFKLPIREQG